MLNQARRDSSLSVPPPSSPPQLLHQSGESASPSEARGVPSPAQTLWTAPSPTLTLGYSSPELPPLATLSALGSFPRTPSTAARHERSDNTAYYTASWGSPYRHPPPSFNRSRQTSAQLGSDDLEDTSNLQFGLEHLLPRPLEPDDSPGRFNLEHLLPQRLEQDHSPNQFNLEYLIPSRLPSHFETPTKDSSRSDLTPRQAAFTSNPSEEWVRQFLDGRWNRASNNWLSEGTAGSESDSKALGSPSAAQRSKKTHKARKNNKTLNQQDFWSYFSEGQKQELGKMMASRYADPETQPRQEVEDTSMSAPGHSIPAEDPAVEPATATENTVADPPTVVEAKSNMLQVPVARSPAPPMRKKVQVKGKNWVIAVPKDIPRGMPGYPPKPMSPAAVGAKLQQLQQAGYDIRGFGNWNGMDGATTAPPQNRAIWPDDEEIRADRARGHRVRVPNKADWDAYVAHLMEAKLAALGVSLGGEEEEAPSRQPSVQQHPGLPFSPPLPTSSAGSHRIRQGSIVSGSSFPLGPSPGHMSRQSIASPMSAFGNPRASMHMHRHSTFASPANFAQQTASPSGNWSPGGYFGPQGARGGSPALPLSRPDLSEVVSPISPFGMRPGQQFPITPTQRDDFLAQMQQQQQQLQNQLVQQQQQQQLLGLRPASTLAEVPEDEAEEDEVPAMKHATKSGPEIAGPTPRGHRHNISANLEREAQDAEYHLEQAIDKQFDEGGDFNTEPEVTTEQLKPSNPLANSSWEASRPVLHQPQPHNRTHSLAQAQQSVPFGFGSQPHDEAHRESEDVQTNMSDATDPSFQEGINGNTTHSAHHSKAPSQISNSWKDAKLAFGKPASAMHSKHTSRSSISRLNVEAKEFKFNPSASFSPGSGSFASSFTFSPALKSDGFESAQRSKNASIDGMSSLSVTAPAFKPDAPSFKPDAPAFKPTVPDFKPTVDAPVFSPSVSTNGNAMPSTGFSFFSNGPSFKPDAPAFNPGSAEFNPTQAPTAPTSFSSKIFGNVSITADDIIKPAKRSKAIPIMRPDAREKTPEREEEDKEEPEDEEGRIKQADGREKRARRGRTDGDDVPKFALQPTLSSQPLSESKQPQAAKQDPHVHREAVQEDKENLSPEAERSEKKTNGPEPLSITRDAPVLQPSFPTPLTGKSADTGTSIDDGLSDGSQARTPTIEEVTKPTTKKHRHRSSLSATAKPFEFRPQFGTANYDFGLHVTKPSNTQSDLDVSHPSPPRHGSRSPATTFRPSDDGSYKTALESRRHVQYPESESVDFDHLGQASFNDIDAVMKHMDEEGSDFGVERDEPAWEQSSPRHHDFTGRPELAPNANLRSDAPSPSPRRLYQQRNVRASSTSIARDPFDDERAGMAYESPVHRLNNAENVPMSDWDEGLLSEGEDKIQTRSRFFDSHVDKLMGRLLQDRLGPLEQNLQGIQDAIASMSSRPVRGRRSMSTNDRLDSDADDEDDDFGADSYYRNRSPKKDRKMEKMRAIIKEALDAHQQPIKSSEARESAQPDSVRDIIMEALAHHQPQWTPPKLEPVPAEQIRMIVEEALLSHQPADQAPSTEPIRSDDIRAIVADALATHASQIVTPPAESTLPDELRSIVMDAFATHVPPPLPAPVPEQIWPDDIRSIVTEALAAQKPAAEPVQPEIIRSIVADALASHQAQAPVPTAEPVQPDMIRSIVAEALASHKPTPVPTLGAPVDIPQPQIDLSEIYQVIGSLKASIAQTTSNHLQVEDVRELLDDAFKRQNMEVAKREESQAVQEKDARIEELEILLKETSLRLAEETELRTATEVREAEGARLLRVTEEELTLLKEAASDDEHKIRALKDECEVTRHSLDAVHSGDDELRAKMISMEAENDDLKSKASISEALAADFKKKLEAVTAENEALTFTLEEHRISANKWRDDIQKAHDDTENMRKAIEHSKMQAEEAARVREAMRHKFEKLQQDMSIASGQAAAERAQWQKTDEAHLKKYEVLSARIEAEGRTRERLERELERLESQEREGMRLRINLEAAHKQNAQLEETIQMLKQDSYQHQKAAERYEREFREAREAGHVEIRRTRALLEADIETANNQVNIIRADLEAEIARVRTELESVQMAADTAKEKHELDLEAAADAKKQALDESMESRKIALQEQEQSFLRRFEQVSAENVRLLEIAREDKDRAEEFHNERLSIADAKMEHLHDKVALLEEKLNVAKEAASAAAAAAQSVKSPTLLGPTPSSYASGISDKISPQALRESIAVLQEQLQERESRIESLEHELSEVDAEAPAKLKERDTEIGWLRELLGVRVDDLNDLITALAQPSFNRESVRDAAIRIRTNLQMEQQEKERLMTGGQNFPTLATLSNFASPKAVQLAAAFGNWRKGNGSSALAGSSGNNSRNQTPSRTAPASAQSFLSGLMTPPTSNLRRTPELSSSGPRPQNLRSNSNSSRNSAGFPALGKQPQPVPSTPPLLRKASYDQDAAEGFSESGFYDDDSTVDGELTPVGLNFGNELRR